jgi:hypothetical protein
MHDDGFFDEQVAARYDQSAAEMFDPAVVDPVVDFLFGLAGEGPALEPGRLVQQPSALEHACYVPRAEHEAGWYSSAAPAMAGTQTTESP